MIAVRFIGAIIWLGIFFGAIDCLVDATEFMGKKAVAAHQIGLISYGQFSRLLTNTK